MSNKTHKIAMFTSDYFVHVFMKYIHNVCFDRREQFVQWTEKLPDAQSPSWLGLPNNAEKLLLTVQGKNLKLKRFSIFSTKELNIKIIEIFQVLCVFNFCMQ